MLALEATPVMLALVVEMLDKATVRMLGRLELSR